jgi:hypothetical protein
MAFFHVFRSRNGPSSRISGTSITKEGFSWIFGEGSDDRDVYDVYVKSVKSFLGLESMHQHDRDC